MAEKKKPANIDTELSRCVNQLLIYEPFYAHVLAGTVRKITDQIPTAAVGFSDELIILMVNEDFFLRELKSDSERTAVLKHEVLHLVFRHLFRDQLNEDGELFNLAADIVVNQYIGKWKLPANAITLDTFPDLQLKPEESVKYYYEILKALHKANHAAQKHSAKKKEERTGEENSKSTGKSGGAASNQHASKSKTTEPPMNEKHPISAKALSEIYGGKRHSDHSKWIVKSGSTTKTADGKHIDDNLVSGLEHMLGKQILDAFDRTPSKFYGTMHGEVLRRVDQIRQSMKPKIDWKRVLKLFSSACGRTEIYHTMKRVSKRYGTRPGMRIKKFKKLAVAIDTSGSIDDETLALFFAEIDAIYKNGAEIQVIECDAEVGNSYPYKRNMSVKVTGGGGTNYDPVFEYINTNKKLRIDACIYLTDGYAPEPLVKPRCKLLYVITPGGEISSVLKFGKCIKMPMS